MYSCTTFENGISYDFYQENIAFESWKKTDMS